MTGKEKFREKLKKDQRLLKTGGWCVGYIFKNGFIVVSEKEMDHYRLLNYFGKEVEDEDMRGGARLVFGRCMSSFGEPKSVMGVEVSSEGYERIRNIILNYVPFYRYVRKVMFEIFGVAGGYKTRSMVLSGEEEGFSLLNPRR